MFLYLELIDNTFIEESLTYAPQGRLEMYVLSNMLHFV